MNTYDRMINMLLEARIEDYLDRLDEASRQSRANAITKRAMLNTPGIRNAAKFGNKSDGGGPDGGKSEEQEDQESDQRRAAHKAARGVRTRGVKS
jgi:hypothetical protein